MAGPIDQERINRSFSDQVRQLTAERDQLRQELTQRWVDNATATIKGLETLVALAAAGNPAARIAVKSLLDALDNARAAMSALVVARS